MAAARTLGYRPNALARDLVGSRTDLVGVVVGNFDTPFEPFLFDWLTDALATVGKKPLVVRGDPAGDVARPLLTALRPYRYRSARSTLVRLPSASKLSASQASAQARPTPCRCCRNCGSGFILLLRRRLRM